mgnify:CR=1 FL=1
MPNLKIRNSKGLKKVNASQRLRTRKIVSKALWECLVEDDPDGFKEILKTNLELVNKDEFAKEVGISRRTLFRMLSDQGNPTLDNVSKIIHKLCA